MFVLCFAYFSQSGMGVELRYLHRSGVLSEKHGWTCLYDMIVGMDMIIGR